MTASSATSVQAVDWTGGLESAWSSIAEFVPKLLIFVVILLIGWIIAKVVSKLVGKILEKVGLSKAIDKAGLSRFFSGSFTAIDLIAKLIYYFILLIALQLALTAFGPQNPVSQIVNDILNWLPRAIVAIIIIIVVSAIAGVVREILSGALSSLSYGDLLAKIVAIAIIAFGVVAALTQAQIAVTVTNSIMTAVLATIAGILIVGVGGGLIGPMRQRWEHWLGQLESDTSSVRESSGEASASQRTQTFDGGYNKPNG